MKKQITLPSNLLNNNILQVIKTFCLTLAAILLTLSVMAQSSFVSEFQQEKRYYNRYY